jgi:RNA polymerase sigma-70 factor (ECF subfamily)
VSPVTDRELLRGLHKGHGEVLRCVYERYKDSMLALAVALSRDRSVAEDVVHDVFVAFAGVARTLHLRNSLRSYLLTAVANRVRSLKRRPGTQVGLAEAGAGLCREATPDPADAAGTAELLDRTYRALDKLPQEQRETIVLHLQAELPFRQIARIQGASIGTVLSRYRYGLGKLRQVVDREAMP